MIINYEGTEDEFWNKFRQIMQQEIEKIIEVKQDKNLNEKLIDAKTTLEPIVSDNGRYPTMNACAILGISYKTLIKYTDQGKIRCGIRKSNGRKFYTGADIKKFWKATY